MDTNY